VNTAEYATTREDVLDLNLDAMQVITPNRLTLEQHAIVGFARHDKRGRCFNMIRTQLVKIIEAGNLKLIGITSATPEAGKSFIALNIAAALARVSDDPVFLVDLDLRRGTIANELGVEPEVGVGDYLLGEVSDLQSIGWQVDGTNLHILPTNVVDSETARLLSGQNFSRLIRNLRQGTGNSLVIIDLPPAFASDDAMITMQQLDAFLMVIDSGRTNRKQLLNSLMMFEPTPCIGTILNRYRGGLVDASGYGYGYGSQKAYDKYY
jgi:protein-tyrosine kinase